jgi:hypothetical protein
MPVNEPQGSAEELELGRLREIYAGRIVNPHVRGRFRLPGGAPSLVSAPELTTTISGTGMPHQGARLQALALRERAEQVVRQYAARRMTAPPGHTAVAF